MEDKTLYWPILKMAWQIAKKIKNLWFFGLFAAIVGGGEFEILVQAFLNPHGQKGIIQSMINSFQNGWQNGLASGSNSWQNIWAAIINQPGITIFLILLIGVSLAVTLFILWLAVASQIGLVRNIHLGNKNKKTTINEGIDFANANFWPIAAINLLMKIVLFILFLILGKEIIMLAPYGLGGKVAYYLSFAVLIVIVITISFILRYQICYFLLKKEKFTPALKAAWRLFLKNWLISLEMAFILFAVYCFLTLAIFYLANILLAIPFVLIFYSQLKFGAIVTIGIVTIILTLTIILLFTAVWTVFQWAAWILLFNRLVLGEGLSKIIRVSKQIGQLPGYLKK